MTTCLQEISCWINLDNTRKMLVSKEKHLEDLTKKLSSASIKSIMVPVSEVLAESLGG